MEEKLTLSVDTSKAMSDIEGVSNEIAEIRELLEEISKKKFGLDVDIDTKTLKGTIENLDKMFKKLGNGNDFKDFDKLGQCIIEINKGVQGLSKSFGELGNQKSSKSFLSSIQSIETSLNSLSKNLGNIVSETSAINNQADAYERLAIAKKNSSLSNSLNSARQSVSNKIFSLRNKIFDTDEYKEVSNDLNRIQDQLDQLHSTDEIPIIRNLNNDLTDVESKISSIKELASINSKIDSIDIKGFTGQDFRNTTDFKELKGKLDSGKISFKEYNSEIDKLIKKFEQFANKGTKAFDDIIQSEKEAADIAHKMSSSKGAIIDQGVFKENNGIYKLTDTIKDSEGIIKKFTYTYKDGMLACQESTTKLKQEASGLPGLFGTLGEKWKQLAVYWTANLFNPHDLIQPLKEVINHVIDLNTQFTELSKVSDQSIGQLYDDFSSYEDMAKDVGGTISDTISATADWSRLGYSVDEAKDLAYVAQVYKNVGDGIDIDTANESLISTLQGFKMEADEALSIIDKFNEVICSLPSYFKMLNMNRMQLDLF